MLRQADAQTNVLFVGRKLAMLTLRMSLTYMIWSFYFKALPEDLISWAKHSKLTLEPRTTYVRLEEVKH
jgi:hypothetical protein